MDLTNSKLIGKTLVFIDCALEEDTILYKGRIVNITPSGGIWVYNYPTETYLMDEEEEERLHNNQPAWVHMNEVYCYIEPHFTEI
tara:strand:- start:569 stop:823 length:255 start_codon:yes stop_codon:yes gene_type:complete